MLDLTLVPGTPAERKAQAKEVMRRKGMPLEIKKNGSKWAVIVLGVPVGYVKTKDEAESAVFRVGNYMLGLGPFSYSYTAGHTR